MGKCRVCRKVPAHCCAWMFSMMACAVNLFWGTVHAETGQIGRYDAVIAGGTLPDDYHGAALVLAERVQADRPAHADAITWKPLGEPGGGGAIVSVTPSPHHPNHLIAGGDMLGVGVSFDGGESWSPANRGLTSYEMATATFHPTRSNEVWIGSCMGPFKSTDGGRSWTSRREGFPPMSRSRYTAMVEKVLFDPEDASRLIAVGGSSRRWGSSPCQGAIWLSENGGAAWFRAGTITTNGFVREAVKGANIIKVFNGPRGQNGHQLHLVAEKAGWFTSVDGGRTWRRHAPQGLAEPLANVACHPTDPRVVWAVTACGGVAADGKRLPGRIYKSADGGDHFVVSDSGIKPTRDANGHFTTHFRDIAVSPADPDLLYVSDMSWRSGAIIRSRDGGATWMRVCWKGKGGGLDVACYAGPSSVVVPDPHSADCAYAFNSEYILKTTDGGRTWKDLSSYRPDPHRPECWRGRGWNGWCSKNYVFNPFRRGESMMVAMDAAHGWQSTDGMTSWRYALGQAGAWLGANDVAFSRDGYIYVATGQRGNNTGVLTSADNGRTWTSRLGGKVGLPERKGGIYTFAWADPENGRTAFVVAGNRRYLTDDGGASWRMEEIPGGGGEIAADPLKKGRFYLKNKLGIRVTDDWKIFRDLGLAGEAEGRIVCDAKGRLLVCRGRTTRRDVGLWRYDPAAGKWEHLHADRLASAAAADPSDPLRIILVTLDLPYHDLAAGNGLFVSSDDGKTWRECDTGDMMRRFSCVAFDPFDPETVILGTGGGGFFRGTWKR